MSRFIIVADSGSDLPLSFVQEHDIHIIPLLVHFKEETFRNFPDERDISNKNFYARLRDREVAKTSQVNQVDFVSAIEPLLKAGHDVLTITLSSGLSGSYYAMVLGREEMREKYPERTIVVFDSLSASLGEGALVYQAVLQRKAGQSLDDTVTALETIRENNCALFTVDELGTLQRGGRISLTKALLGTLLNMKPALMCNGDGKLVPWDKARGRKNAINLILDKMDATITDESVVFIAHSDVAEEAERLKAEVLKRHPGIKKIIVGEIGPVIGAHSGPGTLAVIFQGTAR